MKKLLFFLLSLFVCSFALAQSTVDLRADTIKMYKIGGKAYGKIDSFLIVTGGIKTLNDTLTKFSRADSNTVIFNTSDSLWYNWNGYWYERQAVGSGTGGVGGGTDNVNVGTGYRILMPTSQSIKTLFNGYGILIDSATNANALTLTSDTSTMATLWNVTHGINLPAEHALKTIYEKSNFVNTGDFAVAGTIVPTISAAGFLDITATTANYTPKLTIMPQRPTTLTKFKMTVVFKITAWAATSNWFGPNLNSVAAAGSTFGLMTFTGVNSAGTNSQYIATQDGTVIAGPVAGPSRSLNDVLEISLELNDSVATSRVRNITTSSATTTLTYTYPSAMTTILPNVANWALMYNSSAGGTVQVQYMRIESNEIVAPTLAVIGNSKTKIGYADFWATRFAVKLNATYPTTIHNAGSAETMQDMIKRLPELMQLNAEQYLLADVWSNDIGAGTSFDINVANFKKLYNALSSGGARVLIAAFPEDSTTGGGRSGLTAFKNWLVANYPNDIIDTWTALDANGDNRLSSLYYKSTSDRIHTNQAGQDLILSTIISSGKIHTQYPNRRAQIRQTDGQVISTMDSLSFKYQFQAVSNFIMKWDTANNIITSSQVYDDGTTVYVSPRKMPKAFSPAVAGIFKVEGTIFTYGANSGVYIYDRSSISNSFAIYNNNNLTRFNVAVVDLFYFGSNGRMQIGNRAGTDIANMFGLLAIRKNESFANGGQGEKAMGIFLDSATFTHTGATTVPLATYMTIARSTWAGTGATTYTNASALWIDGAVAGTNGTGNFRALTINSGISEFKAQITINHTGATVEAAGTTAQRPTAATAMFRWNSDSTRFEGYTGSAWRGLLWNGEGGVGGGGSGYASADSLFYVSDLHLKKVIDSLVALTITVQAVKGLHATQSGNILYLSDTSYNVTPDLNNITNVAASGAATSYFYRHGQILTFGGDVTIDATAAATTVIEIELPTGYTYSTADNDIWGYIVSTTEHGTMVSPSLATSGYARFSYVAADLTNHSLKWEINIVIND